MPHSVHLYPFKLPDELFYQSCGQKRKITSEQQKQTHPSFGKVVSWQLDKVRLIHCLRTLPLSQTKKKKKKSWPAGYIHFNINLEEAGRGEHRGPIRAEETFTQD